MVVRAVYNLLQPFLCHCEYNLVFLDQGKRTSTAIFTADPVGGKGNGGYGDKHAVEDKNMELVSNLLARGAAVNAHPAYKRSATALQFAAMMENLPLALKLLEHGADIDASLAPVKVGQGWRERRNTGG